MVLPWRKNICIEYKASSKWPVPSSKWVTNNHICHTCYVQLYCTVCFCLSSISHQTNVEIHYEGNYHFLHDLICKKSQTNKKIATKYRQSVVQRFWKSILRYTLSLWPPASTLPIPEPWMTLCATCNVHLQSQTDRWLSRQHPVVPHRGRFLYDPRYGKERPASFLLQQPSQQSHGNQAMQVFPVIVPFARKWLELCSPVYKTLPAMSLLSFSSVAVFIPAAKMHWSI